MASLSDYLEHFIILGFNRLRDRRSTRAPRSEESSAPGALALGCSIPIIEDSVPLDETIFLTPEDRRRHLYVLGATGSGKTNLLLQLIASDLEAGKTVVVFDLLGDLVDRIMLWLAASGDDALADRFCLIDLRDEANVVGFNPLLGSGEIFSRAFHLLGVLKQQAESWGVQIEETARNALLALGEVQLSLLEVEPLLLNAEFREEILRSVSDPYVRAFFDRYRAMSADRHLSFALPVLNKITSLLAIPRLRLLLGSSKSLDWSTLIDEAPGRIILVSLAVDQLHGAAHLLGGLLVSSLQSAVMARAPIPEKDRIPMSLYVDEFETMASETFTDIISQGRRFGLSLTLSHQNLSQLRPDLRESLRNNVHTQIYFQTGSHDASELASEINSEVSREDLRNRLMNLQIGEAFLNRRGQETVLVKTKHAPDPRCSQQDISALRKASHAKHALPRLIVEQEVAARLESRRFHSDTTPEAKEVRHAKRPQGV